MILTAMANAVALWLAIVALTHFLLTVIRIQKVVRQTESGRKLSARDVVFRSAVTAALVAAAYIIYLVGQHQW